MPRKILGVLAGIAVSVLLIAVVEALGHTLAPIAENLDPSDLESLRQAMANVPTSALVAILIAWAAGALGGGWTAEKVAKTGGKAALIVGGLLMLASLLNLIAIPHPAWFWVVGLGLFLPLSWIGGKLA